MPGFSGRSGWWIAAILLSLSISTSGWLAAETHCLRVRSRAGLPCRPYGYDDPSRTVAVRTLIVQSPEDVELGGSPKGVHTHAKRFVLSQSSIENGPITLSEVGLVLYETGEAACTGLIMHNGKPLGDLAVNRVRIRVRAYGGLANSMIDGSRNLTGPCLCEWSQDYLVRRGDPAVARLSPGVAAREINRFFNEIVQLELEVTVRNSR